MSTKNGHTAYLKIPGLFIIGPRQDGCADASPAELSAQNNRLTVEEQAFLDGLQS